MYGIPVPRGVTHAKLEHARAVPRPSRILGVNPKMATHAADKNDAHDPRMNYIPLGVDARGYHYVAQTATATVHAISPDGARERWDCDPERLWVATYAVIR